jgi:DnaJ domain
MRPLTLVFLGTTILSIITSFQTSTSFSPAKFWTKDYLLRKAQTERLVAESLYVNRVAACTRALRMSSTDMNWDPKSAPKLDFNEDFYSILEVDPMITSKELKKAYYKIVFKYHPDNKEGKEQKDLCNKQMMVINAAYKVLKDGDARAVYDRKRKAGVYGEAAKVGKSSVGSSNRSAQPQTQKTQTRASSGRSSSDPFGSYGYNQNSDESYESTESLGDIFSDFWSEVRKGETKNLVVDLLDFLEDQVIICGSNSRRPHNESLQLPII